MKCPICKGCGELDEPRQHGRDRAEEKKAMAKTLRDAGYSLRQIQEFIGWKSVASARDAIKED